MKQLTKKILIVLIAVTMLFAFSCTQTENPQNPVPDNTPAQNQNTSSENNQNNNNNQQNNTTDNNQSGNNNQTSEITPSLNKTVNLIYAYDINSIEDDADLFTHVCIAFLQHEANSTELTYDDKTDLSELKQSIKDFKTAHPKVKVLISYGGGDTGSENASTVLNSDKYNELVANIGNFVKTSGVDGIDFDWEYFDDYDTYNPIYPKFVADVKKIAGDDKLYTMAVQTGDDFYGDSDIQKMLKTLDFVNVMTYDFDYDSRAKKQIGYNGNFQSTKNTINAYIDIVGADRTVTGLPFYGIGYEIEGSSITVKKGTATKGKGTEDGFYRIYKYTDGKCITNAKYVTGDNQGGAVAYYIGTRPVNTRKPAEGSNPFIYFYDDPVTIDIKVKWALETKKCIGAMAWVYEDDTEDGILRKAMRTAVDKYTQYEKEDVSIPDNTETPVTGDFDIKDGIVNGATAYKLSNVEGLRKLAEIVNDGNSLAGITITQTEDITINAKVLKAGFLEPDEGADCTPNASLVNLDSIGKRDTPFAGTFDGNGKFIKGLYIYQSHQGLGFFGDASGATIKNVTLLDSCIINSNASGATDGSDDDRFGGLLGMASGKTIITNCIFIGVVGSAAAQERGGSYEYGDGFIGRVDAEVTTEGCTILARCYSEPSIKVAISGNVLKLNASDSTISYSGNNQYVKDAIASINGSNSGNNDQTGNNGEQQNAVQVLKITKVNDRTDRFQFTIKGFDVASTDSLKLIIKSPTPKQGSVTPLLRSANSGNAKYEPTTSNPITEGKFIGYETVTATSSAVSAGLMITLNGTFDSNISYDAYIAEFTINDITIPLDKISGKDVTVELIDLSTL